MYLARLRQGVTAPTFKLENTALDGLRRLTEATETLTKPNNSTIAHSLILGYDSLSQLTSANISNIGPDSWTGDYNYQKNGDMDARTINSNQTNFTYNGNEMITADGNNLEYDLNGNLTTDPTSATFVYNWDSKLRSASKDSQTVSLKYDPSGNRVYKTSSVAGNRKYIVDVVGDLPVILLEIDPTDMSVKKGYIYANSQILAEHDGDYTASRYFYLHDRLGSVRQMINENGAVVVMYTYNPFGETIEEQGTVSNDFKFTGQYYDEETGQYYLRARQYSPYLSRFTGRDLIAPDFNEPMTLHRYLYCNNDSVNWIDPTGLDKYLGFDSSGKGVHFYVAVDLWSEEGRKVGQARYDFQPGKFGGIWDVLWIFLTSGRTLHSQEDLTTYEGTKHFLTGAQTRSADELMKAQLDKLVEDPYMYSGIMYNCFHMSLAYFLTDYDDILRENSIWEFVLENQYP